MENNYKLQKLDKCCANCNHSEDDPLLEIGAWYMCPYQPKEVSWNGICDEHIFNE